MKLRYRTLWYFFWQIVTQITFVAYFRFRTFNKERVPLDNTGLLLVSNHQSALDPFFATLAIPRAFHFLARDTLFYNPIRSFFIRSLGAFPLGKDGRYESSHLSGARLLAEGKAFVIFAEGTRTKTGELQRFRKGAANFAQQAKVPLVPIYIHGAFYAQPKGVILPYPKKIEVYYGVPIYQEQYDSLSNKELTELLQNRISELKREVQQRNFL